MTDRGVGQDNRFAIVPRNVTFSNVSLIAKVVFDVLAQYANSDGLAWPSRATIAEHVGVHPSSVTKALRELKDAGFLVAESRQRGDGSQTSNAYHLLGMVVGSTPPTPAGVASSSSESTVVTPPDQPLNETIERDQRTRTTTDVVVTTRENFDDFWRVYPRHASKPTARKAWDKAVERALPSVILDGARRYRDDPNRDDTFTAYPSTWLNQDKWEDDPLPSRVTSKARPMSRLEENLTEYAKTYGGTNEHRGSLPPARHGISEGWTDRYGDVGRSVG